MKLPSHIKAVIFDMDGLLIDSEPYWAKADQAFFKKYNKPYTPEVNKHIMGMGQKEIMEYFKKTYGFEGDTTALIIERKSMLYSYLLSEIQLLEGVKEILHALYQEELILAIATSGHTKERAEEIVRKVGLKDYFALIVSGDDVPKSKPAPDIYLKTAELLFIDPSVCLVFEDAPNGTVAGKAAGMTVYGVNKDEKIYTTLHDVGADNVFRSLIELIV